jgi:hypothetical protein
MENFSIGFLVGIPVTLLLGFIIFMTSSPSPKYDDNIRQQLFYDCISKQATLKAVPVVAADYCLTFSKIGSKIDTKE